MKRTVLAIMAATTIALTAVAGLISAASAHEYRGDHDRRFDDHDRRSHDHDRGREYGWRTDRGHDRHDHR